MKKQLIRVSKPRIPGDVEATLWQEQSLPKQLEPLKEYIKWLRENSYSPAMKEYRDKLNVVVCQLTELTPELGFKAIVEALQSLEAGCAMLPILDELSFQLFKKSYEADYPQFIIIKNQRQYQAISKEGVSL